MTPRENDRQRGDTARAPQPHDGYWASLLDLQRRGYCTDEWPRWQQGQCGTYAVALMRMKPQLRFGTLGITRAGGGDASSGWTPQHHFAHDDTYAYDSAGRHPLPWHGVHGDADYCELDGDPGDWGMPGDEGSGEDDIAAAQEHARRNRILDGAYGPSAGALRQPPAGGKNPQGEGREAELSPPGRNTLHPGRMVWHPAGPSIGIIRALEGDHARVAFRDLGDRPLPAAELVPITPGDPVAVTFLSARPHMGETRRYVTVRQGEYAGPVPFDPALSRVRIAGILRHVPTEYIVVADHPGTAAAYAAYSRRMARNPARRSQKGQDGTRSSSPEVIQVPSSPQVIQVRPSAQTAAHRAGLRARLAAPGLVEGPLRKPSPGTRAHPPGPAGGQNPRAAKGP